MNVASENLPTVLMVTEGKPRPALFCEIIVRLHDAEDIKKVHFTLCCITLFFFSTFAVNEAVRLLLLISFQGLSLRVGRNFGLSGQVFHYLTLPSCT